MEKLYLVTETYPNPGGDSNFVIPELQELKKRFRVTVICLTECSLEAELDPEVEYVFWKLKLTTSCKVWHSLKYLFRKECWKETAQILSGEKKLVVGRMVKSFEFFTCAEEFYGFLKEILSSDECAVFFTFWSKYYTLPMILHKKKYPGYCLITRLHGCDLYQERYLYKRQPFKTIINKGMDRLYFGAQIPRKYYLNMYKDLDEKKAAIYPLGVERIYGKKEKELGKPFLLVSCSNVIPIKRVLYIAQALKEIDAPIRWVHFGGGIELQQLKKYVRESLKKQNNLEVDLKGDTPNKEVRRFYEENYVDCFITVSSTEGGSPVSVMEAMSAGVPIIGTAVGDLPLMIDGNGILLRENPRLEEIAEAIRTIMQLKEEIKMKMRIKSEQLWEDHYNADTNSKKIAEDIQELSKKRGEVKDDRNQDKGWDG